VNEKIDDRKFHVFYAVMKHMPSDMKQKYRFKADFSGYHYLMNTISSSSTNGDKQTYDDIYQSFDDFDYSEAEQDSIFYTLSVVLLLGNVTFQEQAEKSRPLSLQKTQCRN
jgi:myosin heavy subunit